MKNCIFCNVTDDRVLFQNEFAFAIKDNFPVTPLHCLIIPKRHISDYFSMDKEELIGCDDLLKKAKQNIEFEDKSVKGFNIGMNSGEVAGQTIFHCHIHLIPRRVGDVRNPRGGVRHLIPGKGDY